MAKSAEAFRTISEAADEVGVPQHVLRHWEDVFGHIRPMRRAGGRRYYRPVDLDLLRGVRVLLYDERYTTKGVQKIFRENGVKFVIDLGQRAVAGEPLDVRADVSDARTVKASNGAEAGTRVLAPARQSPKQSDVPAGQSAEETLAAVALGLDGLAARLEKARTHLAETVTRLESLLGEGSDKS
ncbi:MAG: MerR family transcriptional regulator [Pseudomonadota bacterium]